VVCACVVLLAASVAACEPAEPAITAGEEQLVIETGEAAATQLRERLSGRLLAVIQADGPAAAIDVCATEALPLTGEIAAQFRDGLVIKRTSTRVRNPQNAPDSLELQALAWFETEIAAGRAPAHYLQPESNDRYRYYAPLRVATLCVQCHGPPDRIPAAVRSALAARYPQDRAIGYQEGDLRGLIRVSVPLDTTRASR
jgi:hypothetical protein